MTLGLKITVIAAACLAAVALAFLIMDGTFAKKTHLSVWDKMYIDSLESDAHKITAYAIRASSSHNMQPWKVKTEDGGTIEVFADMHKALPAADRENRQLLISQGTFLKELESGAEKCGYKAVISLCDVDFGAEYPLVATVTLKKKQRAGSRRLFQREPLGKEAKAPPMSKASSKPVLRRSGVFHM